MHSLVATLMALSACASTAAAAPVARSPHMRFFRRAVVDDAAPYALSMTGQMIPGRLLLDQHRFLHLDLFCWLAPLFSPSGLYFDAASSQCVKSCASVASKPGDGSAHVFLSSFGNSTTMTCEPCHDEHAHSCDTTGAATACRNSYLFLGACLSLHICDSAGAVPLADYSVAENTGGAFFLGTCHWPEAEEEERKERERKRRRRRRAERDWFHAPH
ncbi:hypothetical protein JCM8097_009255 [Rhodosporidiobolus ruineniae]